nr:hypothetical protein [Kibdelosporangium sp. MJ126-NF4]CTQ96321.1 hypothetical protein [Kibdelosporangium sp. MJ126-NF4]
MAALAVVVIAAAGGFFVRQLYRQQPESTTPAVAREEPVQPSESASTDKQPGTGQVRARKDFADHPLQGAIWPMLQEHFDSINERDYDKWRRTVTRERAAKFPESTWQDDYSSTKDGNILVHRLDWAPDRKLRVMVSFTSTQDLADAPPELPKECIRWRIVLPLIKDNSDNKWKIDVGAEGASPRHDECGAAPGN